jgi:GntR family transcriptional regulator, transcriptional repressor for pyruvate dehydrogenase complex
MSFENAGSRVNRGRVADQILEDLRAQILTRALPLGEKLPPERELADHYGVSGPTIREAIRALTAMGLVETRTGSGSVVTAQVDKLVGISIASLIKFEHMAPRDVFGVLGALYSHAAELAVVNASDAEIESLRRAAEQTVEVESVDQIAARLKRYFATLAEMSHNPLLITLCGFITEVQIGLAAERSGANVSSWREVAGSLFAGRMAIVEALESRDAARTDEAVRTYHESVTERVQRARRGRGERSETELLSSWLDDHVTLGPPRHAGG